MIGRNVPATRTDATLPVPLLLQVRAGPIAGRRATGRVASDEDVGRGRTAANGAIIRLAAVTMSVFIGTALTPDRPARRRSRSRRRLMPIQLASTDAESGPFARGLGQDAVLVDQAAAIDEPEQQQHEDRQDEGELDQALAA